jgi:hypothetical protein
MRRTEENQERFHLKEPVFGIKIENMTFRKEVDEHMPQCFVFVEQIKQTGILNTGDTYHSA